jgi:probable selenium-dependent hydroxylase accessory protein YqeC
VYFKLKGMSGVKRLLSDNLPLKGGGVISFVGAGGKTTLMFRLARELAEAGKSVLVTTTENSISFSQQNENTIRSNFPVEIIKQSKKCYLITNSYLPEEECKGVMVNFTGLSKILSISF